MVVAKQRLVQPAFLLGFGLLGCLLLGISQVVSAKPLHIDIISDNQKEDPTKLFPSGLAYDVLDLMQSYSKTELKLVFRQVTMRRVWRELRTNQQACSVNKIKTPEREAIGYFSNRPLTFYPPVRLIGSAKTLKDLPNSLSLKQLPLHNLKIGVVSGRIYGSEVDAYIAEHPKQIWYRASESSSVQLINMMEIGRVDAVFEFSSELNQFLGLGLNGTKRFKYIDLQLNSDGLSGYLVCSRSTQGKQALDIVDKLYANPKFVKSYQKMVLDYFPVQEHKLLQRQLQLN